MSAIYASLLLRLRAGNARSGGDLILGQQHLPVMLLVDDGPVPVTQHADHVLDLVPSGDRTKNDLLNRPRHVPVDPTDNAALAYLWQFDEIADRRVVD
jgi:hypothetical protein